MAAFPAKKTSGPTHEEICRDIRAGNAKPIYYLMGEESYYIDRLTDFIVDTLLKPDERDFNLMTLYGADTDAGSIILAARGFPMGAQRLVVVVREAQNLLHSEFAYILGIEPNAVPQFIAAELGDE